MDKLSKEIRKQGLSMVQFCDKVLNTDYKAFRARIRQQRLRLSEIKLILIYTNVSFEDLFGLDNIEVKQPTSKNKPTEDNEPIKEDIKILSDNKPVEQGGSNFDNFIDTW